MYNAVKDYTEFDQVNFKYRELEAQQLKRNALKEQAEFNKRSREALRQTLSTALKDRLFLIVIGGFIAIAIVVSINIFK